MLVLYRRQLARVVGVRVRSASKASSGHRIQRLGQVGSSLQNDLLGKPLWISRVSRHQFAQPAEPVINRRLVEGWKLVIYQLSIIRFMIDESGAVDLIQVFFIFWI